MRRLQPGDQVPHFNVKTLDGAGFDYEAIWQRRNLLLVVLPEAEENDGYAAALRARGAEFKSVEAECVITRDRVAGLAAGVVLADKWGEIIHVVEASGPAGYPPPDELLEWLEHIHHRCPECEGEAW